MNDARFDDCVRGSRDPSAAPVDRDTQAARSLAISSTPTFLLGSRVAGDRVKVAYVISGARPFSDFAGPIDTLLAARTSR